MSPHARLKDRYADSMRNGGSKAVRIHFATSNFGSIRDRGASTRNCGFQASGLPHAKLHICPEGLLLAVSSLLPAPGRVAQSCGLVPSQDGPSSTRNWGNTRTERREVFHFVERH